MQSYDRGMMVRGSRRGLGWTTLVLALGSLAGLLGLIAAQGCTGEEVGHSTTTTKRTTDTPTERTTVTEVHEKDTTLTPR